ncbi:MAG: alanine--tRNA ligase-related protein [Candidatus Beckwithbacteria bacterium]
MTSAEIRSAYLKFFKDKGHAIIPPAPLVPTNDPTTLFTSSGMQQLVPFLKGESHPMGQRLVDSQPCFRAEDIDEVGDNRHTTFFEMLGNWSLGDYFKAEQLPWIWEFFTKTLELDPQKLHITVYAGSKSVPKDLASFKLYQKLKVPDSRIHYYPENWWSRSGSPDKMPPGEIGGPDSEIFFEFSQAKHNPKYGQTCHPNCNCGRFLEIGNSVFMEFEKQNNGSLKPLPKKNVDFGGGLERIVAAVNNDPDIFKIDIFQPMISYLEKVTGKEYIGDNQPPMRIIADHLRAAKAMIDQGLEPSNKQQGYILRRLIRRACVKMRSLKGELLPGDFPENLQPEVSKFRVTLEKGLKLIDKQSAKTITPQFAFDLFQTYGFPIEITREILTSKGLKIDIDAIKKLQFEHQQSSRTASAGMFKAGLADHSETVIKFHTATHLLHQALRQVLGDQVHQEGSNITSERLRFDFSHPQALSSAEMHQVETIINQQIKLNLPVKKTITSKEAAIKSGALAFFKETYPDKVSVYSIGSFSKEICGGPHVNSTGEIEGVKLIKQESIGANKRRLYAVLTHGTN